MTQKILVAVDGSEHSMRAVRYAIGVAARTSEEVELHLANAQPAITAGDITRFVSRETIESYQREEGGKALAAAREAVEQARIAYRHHILVGHAPEALAAFARREGCAAIVMGTRGMGGVANLLLGSCAMQLIHLAEVPVTLVK